MFWEGHAVLSCLKWIDRLEQTIGFELSSPSLPFPSLPRLPFPTLPPPPFPQSKFLVSSSFLPSPSLPFPSLPFPSFPFPLYRYYIKSLQYHIKVLCNLICCFASMLFVVLYTPIQFRTTELYILVRFRLSQWWRSPLQRG